MKRFGIIAACLLMVAMPVFTGCAPQTARVATQRSIASVAKTADLALKGWAVYVVSQETIIESLPSGSATNAVVGLKSKRAKVQDLDNKYRATTKTALDLSLGNYSSNAPIDLTIVVGDLVNTIAQFTNAK
jgi:hypothetical protein